MALRPGRARAEPGGGLCAVACRRERFDVLDVEGKGWISFDTMKAYYLGPGRGRREGRGDRAGALKIPWKPLIYGSVSPVVAVIFAFMCCFSLAFGEIFTVCPFLWFFFSIRDFLVVSCIAFLFHFLLVSSA